MFVLLKKLCVWFLSKRKITVIINADIEGRLKLRKNSSYMYNNNLPDDVFTSKGDRFVVPKGKYNIKE